ncbi:MAG: hypothetical protein IH613_17595, partial [Desulfuromonadales bacterium]|nr:hypothetical protein [Desulfuromonadales bacterium]
MDGKLWFRTLLAGLMLTALVMAGCEGDDGAPGAPGASAYEIAVENGFTGTEQEWLDSLAAAGAGVADPVETCVICHGEGSFADAEVAHTVTGETSYTVDSAPALVGDEVVMTFAISVDGVPFNGFTNVQRAVIFNGVTGVYTQYDFRNIADDPNTVVDESITYVTVDEPVVDGIYTLRLSGTKNFGTAEAPVLVDATSFNGGDTRYYFRLQSVGVTPTLRASVSADDAAYARLDLASDQACINCHGNYIGSGSSHHFNPFQVSNCIACHAPDTNPIFLDLPSLVHGIHNSHNMPSGEFVFGGEEWGVTYPTYMTNCSVCHDSDAALAVANAMPVSGPNCLSCHGDMTSWDFDAAGVPFHSAYDATTDCQACHVPDGTGIARATVVEFHNGLTTERAGLIMNGRDASVTEGARIDHQITGVTRTGDSLAITWEATVDGIAVNPCNTTATVDAPTFDSGYSVLKAFFQGGDLVNADNGNSSPGQANSTNLDFTAGTGNTVCAGNVATTTITLTPEEAVLTGDARVALQGKANIFLAEPSLALGTTIQTRSKTPTFDFALATGAATAGDRRSIAVSENCLKCHVGSLYQHGGNRVDNVDLCVMCHNEASSEQNVREGMGVDPSEAY